MPAKKRQSSGGPSITRKSGPEGTIRETVERYRSLFDRMMDGVYVSSHDGRFIEVNAAMVRMFGFSSKEEMKKVDIKRDLYFAPSDRDSHVLDSGIEKVEVFRMKRKDGSEIWVEDHGSYIHDEQGNVLFHEGIIRDVTERVYLEEQIREITRLKERMLGTTALTEKMKHITDGIVNIFDADFARLWIVRKSDLCENGCPHAAVRQGPDVCLDRTRCLHLISSSGRYTHTNGGHRRVPLGSYKIGRVAAGEDVKFILNDVSTDPRVHDREWAKRLGLASFAGFRLVSEDGKPIGVLAMFSKHPITPDVEHLLQDLANTTSQIILAGTVVEALHESEEKYRTLFEESKDAIFINTPDGKILDINPAGIRLFGSSSKEEILRRNIAGDFYWNPADRVVYLERLRRNGFLKDYEVELKRLNGTKIVVEETSSAVFDEKGAIVAFRGILRDITERKLAEEALRFGSALLDHATDSIFAHDLEGNIIYLNEAAHTSLGYTLDELLHKTMADIDLTGNGDGMMQHIAALIAKEEMIFESNFRHKNGSSIPVEIHSRLIERDGKKFIVSAARDITERKRVEQDRLRLEERLREVQKLESIGTLAGGIAHDFNNILTIILAYSAHLQKSSPSPEEMEHGLGIIKSAVERGANLVRQILTFARKSDAQQGNVDVHVLIGEIVKMLSETLPKTIMIETNFSDDLPIIVGDATQIHQALLNICINARDAMPEGGVITLRTDITDGTVLQRRFGDANAGHYVQIAIHDNGCGMDENTKNRIYDPFFTTKDKGKGTGLGLAVVYGIVTSHKGFITVESAPGKGSVFHLYFPVLCQEASAPPPDAEYTRRPEMSRAPDKRI